MIINIKQIQELLNSKNISTNQIQDITGFPRKNIWMYRTERTKLMNMQLKTLIKLQECYNLTHDNIMKYKNYKEVIEQFNNRFGKTEIYLDPKTNELKTLIDGIIGDIKEEDIKVYSKNDSQTVNVEIFQEKLNHI